MGQDGAGRRGGSSAPGEPAWRGGAAAAPRFSAEMRTVSSPRRAAGVQQLPLPPWQLNLGPQPSPLPRPAETDSRSGWLSGSLACTPGTEFSGVPPEASAPRNQWDRC